jgi:site-specific DNA recombinase
VIGPWIAETHAKKVAAQAEARSTTGRRRMSRDEIKAVVTALGNLVRVVQYADPQDRADIYAKLGLTPTYQPSTAASNGVLTCWDAGFGRFS